MDGASLDFGAGIAVCALGHCHPHLVAALTGQAGRLWHTSNLYHIPDQAPTRRSADGFVLRRDGLFSAIPAPRAVEASLKTALKYQFDAGNPERTRFIVFDGSFHGRTLALIAAGASEAHRTGFGPPFEGFDRVAYGDLEAVRARR